MRKPLVMVCGVAAVLLAGGLAATTTTAGAETTPDVPGLALPDIPAIPRLPWDDDAPDQNGPGGLDLPGMAAPGQDGQQDPADQDQPAQGQGAQQQDAQDQDAHDQNGQDQNGQDQNGQGTDGDGRGTGGQDQGPHRPGGQHDTQGDAAARPQHRPALTTLAAAQREVSPSSVSTSPAAPVQQQVLALVNVNRRRGGCDELSLDRRLILAAYGHAADMARRGYFAHESPNGAGAGDRVQDAGYRWSRYGENIARGQDSTYEVVDGWMHSPEHRENIMDCGLRQMGIGLAFSGDRQPYWVQDFATES